jgi:hypothetical protein
MTNSFDNSEKQLADEIYSQSVTIRLNEDNHQPEKFSNTSLRQDDFAHSTPFTATVVSDTNRQNSHFLTQEHSSFKDGFDLRSKLNFSGESGSVPSPPIFSQRNRVPTQLTSVNDPFRPITTARKSQQIGSDIFRDAINAQSPVEHSSIVANTNTACNENIAHVHLANQEFLSKWLHPLNLINLRGMGLSIQKLGGINSNNGLIYMIFHRKK